MSLVWQRRTEGPATHVFIIGVDHYRHLPGGDDPRAIGDANGLEQLSSPGRSADAFVRWLVTSYDHPTAPLGSIEMLKSRPRPVGIPGLPPASVDAATCAAANRALFSWMDRCDSDGGNVALFYYAGHGVWRERGAILFEDFGATPRNPFHEAWDVHALREGMTQCKAEVQCYFVDACRKMTPGLESWLRLKTDMPLEPRFSDLQRAIDAPLIYATGPGRTANGDTSGTTLFLQALLIALDGVASRKTAGCWRIKTSLLTDGINVALEYLTRRDGAPRQQCFQEGSGGTGTPLHRIASKPKVILKVQLRGALSPLPASCELRGGGAITYQGPFDPTMCFWEAVAGDDYELCVASPGGRFADSRTTVSVLPPPEFPFDVLVEVDP
jgi:hypothetical protein